LLNNQIGLECTVNDNAFELDGDLDLSRNGKTTLPDACKHQGFVDGFQQSRPKVAMKLKAAIDNGSCDRFDFL
jgi:hypothetical protein